MIKLQLSPLFTLHCYVVLIVTCLSSILAFLDIYIYIYIYTVSYVYIYLYFSLQSYSDVFLSPRVFASSSSSCDLCLCLLHLTLFPFSFLITSSFYQIYYLIYNLCVLYILLLFNSYIYFIM